jgi:hypothetical protein
MPRTHPDCRSEWSGRAVFTPAFCAGGLFCGSVVLAIQQCVPATAFPVQGGAMTVFQMLAGLLLFLPVASIVGMVLSVLPILVGVTILAAIGRWNIGTRHPAFWALTGGAAPAGVAFATGSNVAELGVLAFILTGAACAAIARRYVRWSPIEE